MASHLELSGSCSPLSSNSSRGAASLQRQSPPRRASPEAAVVGAAAEDGWTVVGPRKAPRPRRPCPPPRRMFRPLPTSRTWGVRWVPPAMRGLCYNCLEPDHISAFCTNEVKCFLCRVEGHRSSGCTNPGGLAPVPKPVAFAAGGAACGGGRAPSSAARGVPRGNAGCDRPWRDVVRDVSPPSSAASVAAPVGPDAVDRSQSAGVGVEELDICVVTPSEEMVDMENELRRAVLVTITGDRPPVDLSEAAELIHARLNLGPMDFSIRAFEPEDFLIICSNMPVRDSIVMARGVDCPRFALSFRPWLRQLQAEQVAAPFLVKLDLHGIPGHAWSVSTARALLDKIGWVEEVDRSTILRHDMSRFGLTAWTSDPRRIPPARLLDIVEPDVGAGLHVHVPGRGGNNKRTLRYKVRFVLREVRGGGAPPRGSSSSSDDGGHDLPPASVARDRGQAQQGGAARRRAQRGDGGGQQRRGGPYYVPRRQLSATASPSVGSSAPQDAVVPELVGGDRSPPCTVGSVAGPDRQPEGAVVSPGVESVVESVLGPQPAPAKLVEEQEGPPQAPFVQIKARTLFRAISPASVFGPRVQSGTEEPLALDGSAPGQPAMPRQEVSLGTEKEAAKRSGSHCGSGPEACPLVQYKSKLNLGGITFGSFGNMPFGEEALPHATMQRGPSLDLSEDFAPSRSVFESPELDQCVPSFGSPCRYSVEVAISPPTGELSPVAPVERTPVADAVAPALGFFTPAPQDRDTAILNEILAEIRAHTRSPLLPLPNVQAVRKRKKNMLVTGTPRRSSRLALKAPQKPASMVKRSQQVLMQKMGICTQAEVITVEHLDMYAKYFDDTMSRQQVQALASLFALSIPEESELSISF